MKKQYVISFRNVNTKLSQATRYLVETRHGYPVKTLKIGEAAIFETKAKAHEAIAAIGKNNLYHTEVNIILK